jgi:hypothetical protein
VAGGLLAASPDPRAGDGSHVGYEAVVAVTAALQRVNPLRLLRAGGLLGFAGVVG